ncbi:MAG: Flp pilus assembly complex ATPase component TadA, partial [Deltaproteobacteria bacterium]|nr:Flp pilus assembly complex ATPase component TadA [Deltaproteobacteria bacterium]
MDFNFPSKQISELEEKLQIRKALQDITNRIHAAQNIKQILVDLKEGILKLFDAETMTIYVVDRDKNEIFSMFLAGTKLQEIRIPISNRSIAGFVANTQKIVNIPDAYVTEDLKKIDRQLSFDGSWDKKSGFKTKQILGVPILRNNTLMGVIQVLNKKTGKKFTDEEVGFAKEIAEVLAVAFYNQERLAKRRRTRFDYLIKYDLIKEEDLDSAWEESRKAQETMENFLMNKYRISKTDIGKSFEEFYQCKYIPYNEKTPIPTDLLANLRKDYLRRELWVPIGKVDQKIHVIVDDPNNLPKKDMIEGLLKSKAVKYDVSMAEDIIKYVNLFYQSSKEDSSIIDILGQAETEEHYEDDDDADVITESDSVIMQIVNKVINDACNRRSSDIHIEPNISRKNVEVRFRVDGDCSLYQTLPFNYRAAIVSRIKIMSNLDITVKRQPQDGKIKFRRQNGEEIELRVATIPTQGAVEDVVMRI